MIWFVLACLVGIVVLAGLALLVLPARIEARRMPMDAQARRAAPGEFAELSQGTTHYQWIGPMRGPVAVCVHGLMVPSFVWGGVARGLAGLGYRVLVYDLYGRGYSDRPDGAQDRTFFLRQLADLLEDQEIDDDITLIGYSMGGAIATAFAATYPDRVRQLVLLAPVGMGRKVEGMQRYVIETPGIGDRLMQLVFPANRRKSARADRDLPSSVEGIVDLQLDELKVQGYVASVLSSLRGIMSEDLRAEHKAIHKAGLPVLAIWGHDDTVVPLSAMSKLTEWSRSTRQEVVEGAGHGLIFSHTDQVLDAMRDALRDGLN